MPFESLGLQPSGVKLWKDEFVLVQILVILVKHLPTWVILRLSQNNEHNKQLASSKKQPSNSLWHLFVPSSKANKSPDSPWYIPFSASSLITISAFQTGEVLMAREKIHNIL